MSEGRFIQAGIHDRAPAPAGPSNDGNGGRFVTVQALEQAERERVRARLLEAGAYHDGVTAFRMRHEADEAIERFRQVAFQTTGASGAGIAVVMAKEEALLAPLEAPAKPVQVNTQAQARRR